MPAPPGSDDDDEGLAAGLREVELSNGCRPAPYLPPGRRAPRQPPFSALSPYFGGSSSRSSPSSISSAPLAAAVSDADDEAP
jgi:hypothetical protein